MMWISLENMTFHAFHGVYEGEQVVGNAYLLDVFIQTAGQTAAAMDAVEHTINYETVYQICQKEMDHPRKLLEAVVYAIAAALKHQFSSMHALRIRLCKLSPPVGGQVGQAVVEETFRFASTCPKCKGPSTCYADHNCWCKEVYVLPATLETMRRQFGSSCLCASCLGIYAG